MAAKRKPDDDDDTINISARLLASIDSILDSKSLLQLPDLKSQRLKEKSTLLSVKHKPADSIENELGINIDDVKLEIEEAEDDPHDEEEERKIIVLQLPREMLTAYILLCLKNEDDWKLYGCCGKCGVFLAYVIPFGIQIIVTMALMSHVRLDKMKIDTSKEQIVFNLCALTILFIYIFDKSIALLKSTWYYLNKLQKDKQNRNKTPHYEDMDNLMTQHLDIEQLGQDVISGVKKIGDELTDFKIEIDPSKMKMDESGKRWALFCAFKLQIICVFIMHFGLMLYALFQINSHKHLADKLEVAISVFFILEVDDWAYSLFIAQNMILSDNDFDIELNVKTTDHSMQLSKNKQALWCSLICIILSVTFVILGSYLY